VSATPTDQTPALLTLYATARSYAYRFILRPSHYEPPLYSFPLSVRPFYAFSVFFVMFISYSAFRA